MCLFFNWLFSLLHVSRSYQLYSKVHSHITSPYIKFVLTRIIYLCNEINYRTKNTKIETENQGRNALELHVLSNNEISKWTGIILQLNSNAKKSAWAERKINSPYQINQRTYINHSKPMFLTQ